MAEPTKQEWQQYLDLVCQLSPENLSCDGMLSPKQITDKRRQLVRKWKRLDKQVGRTVTEDEVIQYSLEK